MKVSTKRFILAILIMGLTLVLTLSFQTHDQVTEEQAIELAEKFIQENGYTILPPNRSKLSYELFDVYEVNVDSFLKRRYNTLQPKAFCVYENDDRWSIGFLSARRIEEHMTEPVNERESPSGRAVIVTKDGKEIRMAHKTPVFSVFRKL
jgi:hypothetical protein